MKHAICISLVAYFAHATHAQDLVPDPDSKYQAVRRAVFLNLYKAGVNLRDADHLLEALADEQPTLFSEAFRKKLAAELEQIKREKKDWLKLHEPKVKSWTGKEPYKALLPESVRISAGDSVSLTNVGDIRTEYDYLHDKLSKEKMEAVYRDYFSNHVRKSLQEMREASGEKEAFLAELEIIRMTVFQYIGWIGGNRTELDKVLKALAITDLAVNRNRKALLVDVPRLVKLRVAWLHAGIKAMESSKDDVAFGLPSELLIPNNAKAPKSKLLTQSMRFELRKEEKILADVIGNEAFDAVLDIQEQARIWCRIRAKYIIDTYEQSQKVTQSK